MKFWPGTSVHAPMGNVSPPSHSLSRSTAIAHGIALNFVALLYAGMANAALPDSIQGFSPFARIGFTHDTNLLNRPDNGVGPAPEGDTIRRTVLGATLDAQISRQHLRANVSLNQNRHQQFTDRDLDGESHDLQWDATLGETIQGQFRVQRERDQAPIQTGQTNAVERIQNSRLAKLIWGFHPEYAVVATLQNSSSEFLGANSVADPALSGLNRHEQLRTVGLNYLPSTGSQLGIALKTLEGQFPTRQITGPGLSVSNNFQQHEIELSGVWNASGISRVSAGVSSVKRKHDEIPTRDYQGVNYQLEAQFRPTAKTQIGAAFARQIIGVSDVTNSDALARQVSLTFNWAITPALLLKLTHQPQTLNFNGTDGFSTQARIDRLRDNSISLEYAVTPTIRLIGIAQQRRRQSSQANSDYAGEAFGLVLQYVY